MNSIKYLRNRFDDMLVAEVRRCGGIPKLSKDEMLFREAFAEFLDQTQPSDWTVKKVDQGALWFIAQLPTIPFSYRTYAVQICTARNADVALAQARAADSVPDGSDSATASVKPK